MMIKRLLLTLAVLLTLAAVLYGAREILIGPRLVAALNTRLPPALGLEVRVARIGGNYFNRLQLHDLQVIAVAPDAGAETAAAANNPWLELDARRLDLDYSLPVLRHGLEAFLATLQVNLAGGRLDLDLDALAAPSPDPGPGTLDIAAINAALEDAAGIIALLPPISLQELDFQLQRGDFRLTAAALELLLAAGQLELASSLVSLDHPSLLPLQDPLQATLALHDQDGISARVAWGDLLTLRTGELTWNLNRSQIALELDAPLLAAELSLAAELAPAEWHGELVIPSLELARLDALLANPPPLSGAISGRTEIRLDPAAPWTDLGGELALQIRGGAVAGRNLDDLDLLAAIDQGQLNLARLTASLGENHLELERLQLPLVALLSGDWRQLLNQSQMAALHGDLGDIPLLFAAAGRPLAPETEALIPDHLLRLQASLKDGVLALSDTRLASGAGELELPRALIGPWPDSESFLDLPLQVRLKLAINNLAGFDSLWGLPPVAGRIGAELEMEGTPAAPGGDLRLEAAGLQWQNFALDRLEARLSGDRERIRIDHLDLQHNSDRLKATGEFDLRGLPALQVLRDSEGSQPVGPPAVDLLTGLPVPVRLLLEGLRWENFRAEFQLADAAAYAELLPLAWRFHGRLDGEINSAGTPRLPQVQTTLQLRDLRWQNPEQPWQLIQPLDISAELILRDSELAVHHLAVHHREDRFNATAVILLPAVTGFSDPAELALENLQARLALADLGAYADLLPAAWLNAQNGTDMSQAADALNGADRLAGALVLELEGGGTLAEHDFQTAIELDQGRWGDISLAALNGRLHWRWPQGAADALAGEADFAGINLRRGDLLISQFNGQLALAGGRLQLSRGELATDYGHLRLAAEIADLFAPGLDLRLPELTWSNEAFQLALARPARLLITAGRLNLVDLELAGHDTTISLQGGQDPAAAGQLALQGGLHSDNLEWLAPFIPGLRRLEGRLAADFQLRGSLADPELSGFLRLDQGELRLSGDAPALSAIRAEAQFDQRGLELIALQGLWGGAPFNMQGRIDLPPAFPADLSRELMINLELRGEDILFYRAEGIRVRGRTELKISGPLERLRVEGEVAISDGRYTRNVDFLQAFRAPGGPRPQSGLGLFSLTSAPWRDITFNIRLTALQPFLVTNNMARGSLRPELLLSGSGELPVLTGEIYLDPTRISLPSGRFNIESGLIRFPAHDPDRPEFDLLATARLAGYDISLVLQGTADEPIITLSSTPPLGD
ncbi:translocation/assembly module TamB domain-containing protein, partial [Desulfurivibrio sp. C05AmB]|uniref:translocation/assembly module TamB domain-containing protein n=1 Tax=Desulfurivibrio sp. C05AmB TaxID=3374371 RepID=UPI00376EA2F2